MFADDANIVELINSVDCRERSRKHFDKLDAWSQRLLKTHLTAKECHVIQMGQI